MASTKELNPVIPTLGGEKAFAYLAKAKEVAARKKIKVISFGVGQPDIPTFDVIIEEAKKALDEKFTGYTETAGIKELRIAIADYLSQRYGADVDPEEIVVTTGAKTAIFIAMVAYLRPGDEVLIFDPSYPAYPQIAKLMGAKPVYVGLKFDPAKGFYIDMNDVERVVSSKTRMIVINNPHNPTGAIFDKVTLEKLIDLARKYNAILLVDEIYDNFVYEEGAFVSILQLLPREWRDLVLYVNGFSKTFSMTGWRLGYLVVRKDVVDAIKRLAVNVYSCPPSIAQRAGIAALRSEESWKCVKEMIELFKKRRDLMYEELRKVPGFEVWRSAGAFYMFPRVEGALKKVGMDVESFAMWLLEEWGVVVLPGTAFSETELGKYFMRFSFATSERDIVEGIERIRKAIEGSR